MRKVLSVVALLLATIHVSAAPVDLMTARQAAQNFLMSKVTRGQMMTSAPNVRWIHEERNSNRTDLVAYYIVNTDNAFVIVAGDDRAQEILAFGDGALDMNKIPKNMKFWMDLYKEQLEYLQAHPGLMVDKPMLRETVSVEPMLVAKWDQGYPYYSQCPMDGDRRGLTGCATTSLAQVFYKWQYPTEPTPVIPGYTTRTRHFELPALPSTTFDWANMLPEYITPYYNDVNKNAVAWLMRYIGQAEEMDYTNEGSEAWENDILRACETFGYVGAHIAYKATIDEYTHGENMLIGDADWGVMLQDELAAGRPVVYCAYSYSSAYNSFYGHAFNVDGYDATTGMYSINWGWSGTGNGYFALRAFANQGYTYNLGELMVMGIEPPAPIEAYNPVMLPADENYITLTSFRANWTDETPAENVVSYTLEVNTDDGSEPGVYELVLSELFPYATSNSSTQIKKMDSYASNPGWTCSNAYEARGGIRLGGGGNIGTLTTPVLDMTQSGGKMTVVVTMRPYQSTDTDVPVSVSCGNSIESVVVNAEQTYTFVLNCDADANQKVTFTATSGTNTKRIVITQVDIYSSTNDAAKRILTVPTETGDANSRTITGITDKFYTVTNLAEGGSFTYRVRAYYVNGTRSEWSNIETVTLVDNGPAPHEFELGDVNHDGMVNISDVTRLINYLLNGDENSICTTCANVNGDGAINISDVTSLINKLLSNH